MDCNVIKDLLPLYVDQQTGEESNQLIEAHIAQCPQCRQLLNQMRQPLEPEPVDEVRELINRICAKKRRRKVITILAIVLPVLALLIGWWIHMETNFQSYKSVAVSTNEARILKEEPKVEVTQAEKDLAKVIFDHPAIQEAMAREPQSEEDTSYDNVALDQINDLLNGIIPTGEKHSMVEVCRKNLVCISYGSDEKRTFIYYYNSDTFGCADVVEKSVIEYEWEQREDGLIVPPLAKRICTAQYISVLNKTSYEKRIAVKQLFSFLDD